MHRENRLRIALVMCLAVLVLRIPAVVLAFAVFPASFFGGDAAAHYGSVIIQQLVLWLLPACGLVRWNGRPAIGIKAPGPALAAVVLGAAAQCAVMFPVNLLGNWLGAAQQMLPVPENPAQQALAVLALVIVPAVAEEVFFRGGLLPALLEKVSAAWALTLTTLVFALMHGSLPGLPGHILLGSLCGLVMLRYRNVTLCVLVHMAYNAAALALTGWQPAWLMTVAGFAVLLPGVVRLVKRCAWQVGGRMAWTDVLLAAAAVGCALMSYLPLN